MHRCERDLVAAVVGVDGDRAARRHERRSAPRWRPGATSTTMSTPPGASSRMSAAASCAAVVHHVVGARGRGQRRLLRAADRGDHGRAGPAGELDRGVADRARAAATSTVAPGAARPAPSRAGRPRRRSAPRCAVIAGTPRLAPSSKRRRRAGARPARRAGPRTPGRCRPPGQAASQTPHPLADRGPIDALADRVDHAGAVVVRDTSGRRPGPPRPRLFQSVGFTPETTHLDPHLPAPGSAGRSVSWSTSGRRSGGK